ncbi:unnamed protein product [Pseudo-nitzschia multistriata]|uniref:Uncharacterized protein n=1 Tax=Pseudo-nitzschia multistriata TaxID=183589 RepID=A0A448YVN0_9STRA|nr:unnamed protein product [Pseudo-nitzschia multistriata]
MCLDTMTDEEKASLRVGTADLLEMLIKQEKEKNDHNTTEFSFCLGADTFMDLTDWKWKRSKDVLKLLGGRLVVVNRKQQRKAAPIIDGNRRQLQKPEEKTTEESLKERVNRLNSTQLANGEILVLDLPNLDDVSSSKVRNCRDKDVAKKLIPNKVLDYIVSHNLYGFGDEDDGEQKDDAMKG